jgi:hypothetical protein
MRHYHRMQHRISPDGRTLVVPEEDGVGSGPLVLLCPLPLEQPEVELLLFCKEAPKSEPFSCLCVFVCVIGGVVLRAVPLISMMIAGCGSGSRGEEALLLLPVDEALLEHVPPAPFRCRRAEWRYPVAAPGGIHVAATIPSGESVKPIHKVSVVSCHVTRARVWCVLVRVVRTRLVVPMLLSLFCMLTNDCTSLFVDLSASASGFSSRMLSVRVASPRSAPAACPNHSSCVLLCVCGVWCVVCVCYCV